MARHGAGQGSCGSAVWRVKSAALRRSSGGGSEEGLPRRSGQLHSRGQGRRTGRQTRVLRARSGAIMEAAAAAYKDCCGIRRGNDKCFRGAVAAALATERGGLEEGLRCGTCW